MRRIGLLSDTHHFLDDAVFKHFEECDEVWHCGDFGTAEMIDQLEAFRPLKGVYGNIDGYDVRSRVPEVASFNCEDVKVMMIHIGGYPGRYSALAKKEMAAYKPALFISGHSHILKIIYDDKLQCLHMNPGAAGKHGWHNSRTLVRFSIDGTAITNCEVIGLGKR